MSRSPDLKKILNDPTNRIIVVISVILILFSSAYLIKRILIKENPAPITQDQIKIQRGDDIVIVNKNGLIEYRTKDKVFYETWDASRISSFFSAMEAKAKAYAKSKNAGDCKYRVTMYVDRKLVNFCVDSKDEDINQVYDEYDLVIGGGSISDYFDSRTDEGDEEDQDLGDIEYFPTSTPKILVAPTPTGGLQSNYPPLSAGCDAWSSAIVKNRAIISNTYCTTLPTPTP